MVLQAFEETYKREFGFVLEQRSIIVDDLRVRATGKVSQSVWFITHVSYHINLSFLRFL